VSAFCILHFELQRQFAGGFQLSHGTDRAASPVEPDELRFARRRAAGENLRGNS
jgi:hypothetical protein